MTFTAGLLTGFAIGIVTAVVLMAVGQSFAEIKAERAIKPPPCEMCGQTAAYRKAAIDVDADGIPQAGVIDLCQGCFVESLEMGEQ